MSLTPSTMLPLGTKAPDFTLYDTVSGTTQTLNQLKSATATVIMFICNHCPYVKHINDTLVTLANEYLRKGIAFIAICSNDAAAYPADAPDKMAETAKFLAYPFPYLHDATQAVAKAYQAACTPDFYIFDHALHCVYRGQFDDSRPGNHLAVTGNDLRAALDNILNHQAIAPAQKPSIGCNIKWRNSDHSPQEMI